MTERRRMHLMRLQILPRVRSMSLDHPHCQTEEAGQSRPWPMLYHCHRDDGLQAAGRLLEHPMQQY